MYRITFMMVIIMISMYGNIFALSNVRSEEDKTGIVEIEELIIKIQKSLLKYCSDNSRIIEEHIGEDGDVNETWIKIDHEGMEDCKKNFNVLET